MKKTLLCGLAVSALGLSGSAFACSLDAWSDTAGNAAFGGPAETNDIARYSGLCSMSTDAAGDYVQDNSPTAEPRLRARYYVLGGGSGTMFEGFSDEAGGGSLFTVSMTGTTVEFDTGSTTLSGTGTTGWNLIEIDYDPDGAGATLWVNQDATVDAGVSGAASGTGIESVRLGGAGYVFDAYEARRTTAIGALLAGDANSDSTIALADAVLILREALGLTLNEGQPDFNEDGTVALADAVLTLRAALGL